MGAEGGTAGEAMGVGPWCRARETRWSTNGLGSPMCSTGAAGSDLSRASQSNCRASGFEAAPAPTGNYAFDVHINTGITKPGQRRGRDVPEPAPDGVDGARRCRAWDRRDARVVLHDRPARQLGDERCGEGLARDAGEPSPSHGWWSSSRSRRCLLLYHGLVRRRVAETVGQALLMLAMMAGGLWVIMNPTGTVGSLGDWANQAGLGALGAVAGGTPDHSDRTLADSMGAVFSAAVGGPWCFMEFGNVGWCSDPARLDGRLRAAGLAVAAVERSSDRLSAEHRLARRVRSARQPCRHGH